MQKNVILFTWLPFTDLLPSTRYNHILRILPKLAEHASCSKDKSHLRICTYLKVRLTRMAFASERPYRRTIIRASRDFVCIETHTLRNVILTGTASFSACYATYHHMLKGSSTACWLDLRIVTRTPHSSDSRATLSWTRAAFQRPSFCILIPRSVAPHYTCKYRVQLLHTPKALHGVAVSSTPPSGQSWQSTQHVTQFSQVQPPHTSHTHNTWPTDVHNCLISRPLRQHPFLVRPITFSGWISMSKPGEDLT